MPHAIIYCRVSTEEQAEDGHHSLAAQETLCRKRATEIGFSVSGIFRDPGKTATNMHRPGLQDALAQCQQDASIKAFFVQDTDRLARNTKDHLTIRAILQKCGVALMSVSQPMLSDSAEGNMIDTIIASVNQFQSDITARKTLKGLEEKVRNGGWPAKAPLGYCNVGSGPDKQVRTVEVDPHTGPLVRDLFAQYGSGNYTVNAVTALFNRMGLRSHTGKELRSNKVHEILRNRFYIGEVRWHGIIARGTHKPLVDRALFQTVQKHLQARGFQLSRDRKHDFLLRGIVFCAACGRRLIGERHIHKAKSYYRCHTPGGCQPLIPEAVLEDQVVERMHSLTVPQPIIDATIAALERKVKAVNAGRHEVLAQLTNQKTALVGKRSTLEKKWLEGVLTDEEFARLKTTINFELENVEARLADYTRTPAMSISAVEEVLRFAADLGQSYADAPKHIRRLLLQFTWERIETRNKRIVKATPTQIFRLLSPEVHIAHKPVLSERASVLGAGHHPTQSSSNTSLVRLRPEWGPSHARIRPQNRQKVARSSNYPLAHRVIKLFKDPGYLHQLQMFVHALKANLARAKGDGGSSSSTVPLDKPMTDRSNQQAGQRRRQ
jgi:DNA invertase Pin-like site-specific DNA recombinase